MVAPFKEHKNFVKLLGEFLNWLKLNFKDPSQGILYGKLPLQEVMQATKLRDKGNPRQALAFQPFVLGQQSRVSSAAFLGS